MPEDLRPDEPTDDEAARAAWQADSGLPLGPAQPSLGAVAWDAYWAVVPPVELPAPLSPVLGFAHQIPLVHAAWEAAAHAVLRTARAREEG